MNDIRQILKQSFFLRHHMGFMLLATALFGVLVNLLLFISGVVELWFRYPVAVVCSYLFFLGIVRIWLSLVQKLFPYNWKKEQESAGSPGRLGQQSCKESSWTGEGADLVDVFPSDEFGCLLVVFIGFLASIGGGAVYLIYYAPEILGEAFFEFLLAGSLVRSFRRLEEPSWPSNVISSTWLPFGIVLLSSLIFCAFANSFCPRAVTIRDVFYSCGE